MSFFDALFRFLISSAAIRGEAIPGGLGLQLEPELVDLACGLINAFLSPLVPGLVATGAGAAAAPALGILWKTFIFALLGILGAVLAETRCP